MSRRLALLSFLMRHLAKPRLARVTEPVAARRDFARTARLTFRQPPFTLVLPGRIETPDGALRIAHVSCGQTVDRTKVILYLHGGAFVTGSIETHTPLMARLSKLAGVPVMAPEYRLAPEHPFPAALRDARAAWDHLVATGYDPEQIAIGGDSAGGGLALALLAELCRDRAVPALLFAFSPWTDLAGTGASLATNAEADPLLPAERLKEIAEMYLGNADPRDPAASPLYAEFPGGPNVYLQYAETEILRDDVLRMAEVLRRQGAHVEIDAWPDAPHVWHVFDGWIPEARAALRLAALHIRRGLIPSPRVAGDS